MDQAILCAASWFVPKKKKNQTIRLVTSTFRNLEQNNAQTLLVHIKNAFGEE